MALNQVAAEDPLGTAAFGWAYFIVYGAAAVGGVVALVLHSINVYQDLYTKERKSVQHRRHAPKITKQYKLIAILTVIASAIFVTASICGVIAEYSTTSLQCDTIITIILSTINAGKTVMYYVFLARLYTIYEKSAYSYPLKCIYFFTAALTCYGITVIALAIALNSSQIATFGDPHFPNWCGPATTVLFIWIPASILGQDLFGAIGFLLAFMIPLRKTMKAIESTDTDSKITRKILYAGTKTTILTATALLSTVVFLFLTASLNAIFSVPDVFVNQICMMLMTAYYPDHTYYQRLCCCCIACCDRKGKSTMPQEDEPKSNPDNEPTATEAASSRTNVTTTSATGPSIDTMSQLRVAGADIKVEYKTGSNLPATAEEEMVQVTSGDNNNNNNTYYT